MPAIMDEPESASMSLFPNIFVNRSLTILCSLRYRKDFGSSVVARLMAWRPRRGINERSSFAAFSFWEISDVNLFPQRGGNCAQVVRRGRRWADARATGLAGGAHSDGQGESAVHAISRHGRSRDRHQCREG